jgi:hypothetical protein
LNSHPGALDEGAPPDRVVAEISVPCRGDFPKAIDVRYWHQADIAKRLAKSAFGVRTDIT